MTRVLTRAELEAEAQALLDAALRREAVPADRLKQFAYSYLDHTSGGRAACAVLTGGRFMPRRALVLAALIVHGNDTT